MFKSCVRVPDGARVRPERTHARSSVNVEEVIETLVSVGLSRSEAQVYVKLSMIGRAKASDLSKTMDVSRTDAYRTLKLLVDRGFATATLDRPVEFEAQAPDRLFATLLESDRAHEATLERARRDVGPVLSTLRAHPAPVPKNEFRVVKGRPEVLDVARGMVARSRASIHGAWTGLPLRDAVERSPLRQQAVERAREGIDVRIIIDLRQGERKPTPSAPIQIRDFAFTRPIHFLIRDDEEVLLLGVNDPDRRAVADGDVAILTDASAIVGTAQTLFELLWEKATRLQ